MEAARDLCEELAGERELRLFTRADGGGYGHCQFDAPPIREGRVAGPLSRDMAVRRRVGGSSAPPAT